MAATTTPSTSWLLPKLRRLYPSLTFEPADYCAWNPQTETIYYSQTPSDIWQLLHEIGHAQLDHRHYSRDIELIGLERDAWQYAVSVMERLELAIPESIIEQHLDSYRDWLHARSSCVDCRQTGIQSAENEYSCPYCHASWRVNDARTCQLRRYRLD